MARLKTEDVAAIAALIPVVGGTVRNVIELFRLMRRARGEPDVEHPEDAARAQEILDQVRAQTNATLEDAKGPFRELQRIRDRELGRLGG